MLVVHPIFVCNAETKISDKLTMVLPISIVSSHYYQVQPSELHKNQPLDILWF
jgi:hypothetical protein